MPALEMTIALAVLVALMVDHLLSEPAARWHPVVWMGHYLSWTGRWVAPLAASEPVSASEVAADWKHFWRGAFAWCAGAVMVFVAALVLQNALNSLSKYLFDSPRWPAITGTAVAAVLLGLALKPLLAWAMLKREVLTVETALGESLQAGRERLGWLVSRDVAALTEVQVREGAMESLAENLNDSVVAPIFWFVLLGLPGAALYRFANTADAMWGYRSVRNGQVWEWGGKWAAWADDGLSWLPARITAALLAVVSGVFSVRTLCQEANCTPSPNSGWPMAAMALGLGVCLHKPGVYTLNAPGRSPQAADTQRAVVLASNAVWLLAFFVLAFILWVAMKGFP